MDEREARELVSNLSYYEKLILREMLKGLVPTRSERGQNAYIISGKRQHVNRGKLVFAFLKSLPLNANGRFGLPDRIFCLYSRLSRG